MEKTELPPIDRLQDLLEHIDLYFEASKRARKRSRITAKLTPADISLLWAICGDLRREGQSRTSWTPIKEVCENCGLTVEPWDEVSWVVRA